jgi:FtsH-binding integral membrane protein
MNKAMYYILSVLIAILFTAIIFYGAHVFFNLEDNNCWTKYNYPIMDDKNYDSLEVQKQEKLMQNEVESCNFAYESNKNVQDKYKLLFIGIINILILILILFVRINNLELGLLLGVILSSIISIITYYGSSSIIAFILVLIEFILCLFVITKRFKD